MPYIFKKREYQSNKLNWIVKLSMQPEGWNRTAYGAGTQGYHIGIPPLCLRDNEKEIDLTLNYA